MLQKKPFVMLELMIALALLTTSILPFLRYPFSMMKGELDALFAMEIETQIQNDLVALQEMLYKGEIEEERLFGEKKNTSPFSETFCTITLSPKLKRKYKKVVKIHWEKQKGTNETITALVKLQVSYNDPVRMKQGGLGKIQVVAQKKR